MFKADISNCFNQLNLNPVTLKLMGFMLTVNILMMLILTCGFEVAITTMVWGMIVGDALKRKVNRLAPMWMITLFGAGTYNDFIQTQQIVHDTINAVLDLSVKKTVHTQRAEIFGFLIDFPHGNNTS